MQIIEIALLNSPVIVYSEQLNFKRNDRVVVSTQNGLELGLVKEQIDAKNASNFVDIVRLANTEDMKKNCENCKFAKQLLPEIKNEVEKLKLDMKISGINTNLDRTKLEINYTADSRVDFRDLLKVLNSKYKTKIEMRQIGNRDETKLIGAIGMCGRVTCCKLYLSDFDKVSIKMAKNQNLSLNPNKINGMCGRLLCCLKYEDDFYEEMQEKFPHIGQFVSTPDGKGKVNSIDIFKEKVAVSFEKDETTEIKTYALNDIQFNKGK